MPKKRDLTFYFLWLICMPCLAQTSHLIITITPEADLKSILDQICSRDRYLIAYTPELANLKPVKSGQIEVASIDQLIKELFPDQLQIVSLSPKRHLLRSKKGGVPVSEKALSGSVADEDGNPLSDILVYTENGNSTFSDSTGFYTLPLAESDLSQTITFRGIGYKTTEKAIEKVVQDPNVTLGSLPISFDPITVQSKIPSIKVDNFSQSSSIRANSSRQFSSALNAQDLIKKVQFLPGVSADDDLNSEIKIRGSTGNESLISLDGIPLY
ncbi:MAG: hypothetical protein HKN76_20180, partial [Saprospiraceae bacterium]|nr:hypothetical protein [Saprospiraceae bacterium]